MDLNKPVLIDLSKIDFANPRRKVGVDQDLFKGMRENISSVGLRYPIELAEDDNGKYRIISGFTRASAFSTNLEQVRLGENYKGTHANIDPEKYDNWTRIPAFIMSPETEENEIELVLGENLIRSEMNAMDVSQLLVDLKAAYEARHPESQQGKAKKPKQGKNPDSGVFAIPGFVPYIAGVLGISESSVRDFLDLANLSDSNKDKIKAGKLSKSKALKEYRKPKKPKDKPDRTNTEGTDSNTEGENESEKTKSPHDPVEQNSLDDEDGPTGDKVDDEAGSQNDSDTHGEDGSDWSRNDEIPASAPTLILAKVCESLEEVIDGIRSLVDHDEDEFEAAFGHVKDHLNDLLSELNRLAKNLMEIEDEEI